MINATQIRKGMVLKLDGVLYKVVEANFVAPGNWKTMMHTRLRNIKEGTLKDFRFRGEDRVEQAYVEEQEMEFLYQSGEEYVFMNRETFDQISFHAEVIGDSAYYLVPNIIFTVEMYEGRPVGLRPPWVNTSNLPLVERLASPRRSPSSRGRPSRPPTSRPCSRPGSR